MNANKCIYRSKSRLNNWPFSYQLNESLLGKIFLVITDSSLNAIGNSAIDEVRTFYESCSKVKFPTTMGLLKLAFFYPKCKESNPKKKTDRNLIEKCIRITESAKLKQIRYSKGHVKDVGNGIILGWV